jgi:tetratricopeptide (TPR) repeat protein
MKKNRIYLAFTVFFVLAVAAVFYKYNQSVKAKENKVYALLPRKGVSTTDKEWLEAQRKSNVLLEALKVEPTDLKSNVALAALFIQEARVTGNHMYYDAAAMKHINTDLNIDTANFNALVFKSLIYLSQHHFAEGLQTAYKAQTVNPYNAYVYGLMVDANVEMGNYDSAVANADRMVSIRPDLTSYSRISYVREIYGDYPGAIQAMRMAVVAGGPGDENTEWSRVQLAQLYEKTGDFARADTLYQSSLNLRANYPYAFAGLGRIALASKDYNKAAAYFLKADSSLADNSVKEELIDVYRLLGQNDKADKTAKELIAGLTKDAAASNSDDNIGHYGDRELAYAYLKINDVDKALDHAMQEYNRRPENIDVNETVAWVLYKKGDYAKALPYIRTALKTHSKNPVLLGRAALIFDKAGDKQQALSLLHQTSLTNPYVEAALQNEVAAIQ